MAGSLKDKIKLTSVDELLCVPSEDATLVNIELPLIHDFKNHPFKVLNDDKMSELLDSILEKGILTPVIVRPDYKNNGYEMISGHRRLYAARLAHMRTIPCIVKKLDDDEATIMMVDANCQREEILPSERAFSLKMKMDAMRHQGVGGYIEFDKNNDITSGHDVRRFGEENIITSGHDVRKFEGEVDNTSGHNVRKIKRYENETASIVGEGIGMAGRSVRRYIRLTELLPELLDLVDNKRLSLVNAVEISYFNEEIQKWFYEYIRENSYLKQEQIVAIKNATNLDNMTQYIFITTLNDVLKKEPKVEKISFTKKRLDKFFPADMKKYKREEIIISLLEKWKAEQEG